MHGFSIHFRAVNTLKMYRLSKSSDNQDDRQLFEQKASAFRRNYVITRILGRKAEHFLFAHMDIDKNTTIQLVETPHPVPVYYVPKPIYVGDTPVSPIGDSMRVEAVAIELKEYFLGRGYVHLGFSKELNTLFIGK